MAMLPHGSRTRNSTVDSAPGVPFGVLYSDRVMDRALDDLTERAGLERGTDALGLARWDLKAALKRALEQEGWG